MHCPKANWDTVIERWFWIGLLQEDKDGYVIDMKCISSKKKSDQSGVFPDHVDHPVGEIFFNFHVAFE